jgi:hypothetical protein
VVCAIAATRSTLPLLGRPPAPVHSRDPFLRGLTHLYTSTLWGFAAHHLHSLWPPQTPSRVYSNDYRGTSINQNDLYDYKNPGTGRGTPIQAPTFVLPSPQLSCNMLDDFTLKVSPLAGFLVVVSLFVSGYFGLRGDPMVRPFLLIYATYTQWYTFAARRHPDCRVLSPDSFVSLGCPVFL